MSNVAKRLGPCPSLHQIPHHEHHEQINGYTPFCLCFGCTPHILPPLIAPPPNPSQDHINAHEVIENLQLDVATTRDNLILAKISQSYFSNPKHIDTPEYKIGDKIMLSMLNHRKKYKNKLQQQAAKFFPRLNGLYQIVDIYPDASTVTLDMPNAPNLFPTFHPSNIKPWFANDNHK